MVVRRMDDHSRIMRDEDLAGRTLATVNGFLAAASRQSIPGEYAYSGEAARDSGGKKGLESMGTGWLAIGPFLLVMLVGFGRWWLASRRRPLR